jgi:methylase of polypeptide subunit release factors
MPSLGGDLKKAATLSSSKLKKYLEDMEEGGIFKQIGITNFLEGDFFAWYLDIWNDSIYSALQALISQLANYSLVTLDVDPEETRDLLKKLYQNIMPRQLRHNLGEYYTPDWLAERLLGMLCGWRKDDSLKVPNIRPDTRILDPACGSGTFLVLAIKRAKEYALSKGLPGEKTLQQILTNIVGFDLNPLAVIAARTNYLLVLGELLKYKSRDFNITIPVYLCDSILTPQESRDLFTNGVMKINTAVGPFSLPTSLIKAQYIDLLADFLEEAVNLLLSKEEFIKKLTEKFPLIPGRDDKDLEVIYALYEKLLRLEKQGINGIWARIIKNAFAPLFVGEFDYIAGNPPWVNWESLPEQYRQETKSLWESYGLFPHGGMDTILGKGKKDISMIMTYVAMDRYLKKGGKLGFVITQSVFKTSGAGQGFRQFKIKPSGIPIAVIHVDDMVELKPFEGASNRTAVVILKKGIKTKYPLRSYLYWKKTAKGKSIPQEAELSDVLQLTETKRFVAEPVSLTDPTSSWLTGRAKTLEAVRKILGKSCYTAHAGAYSGGANGVFWVNIIQKRDDGLVVISNLTEGTKKEVESVQAAIEPDLIYPLLRGRDVQRWYAEPSAYIILAQDPVKRKGIDENVMKTKYPKTYLYLKRFEEILLKRAAFKRYFTRKDKSGEIIKTGPFYSMFNVSTYTLAPYKVVWREQSSSLTVSVIGKKDDKPIIPDHKLMMISCSTKKEAFYICGMLNSSPARYAAISYAVNIQYDPHLLENINVPRYDSTNTLHIHLAELSEKAHNEVSKGNDVSEIEAEIDCFAARIWGLSEEEVREIQKALEEMR